MAIRLLVPFPYSFECRLRKEERIMIDDDEDLCRKMIIYRSDECLESLLCCDRLPLLYEFDHRSLLFGRADEASNG